jgi:hypothetical protein
VNEEDLVVKSENKSDVVSKTKTIYGASVGEILWKNFLAGFSRGLGGVFVYLIFLLIISVLFYNFVLPKLMPSVNVFMNTFKSLNSVSNIKPESGNLIPQDLNIQKLFGQ